MSAPLSERVASLEAAEHVSPCVQLVETVRATSAHAVALADVRGDVRTVLARLDVLQTLTIGVGVAIVVQIALPYLVRTPAPHAYADAAAPTSSAR